MALGGSRPGAGRPKGAQTLLKQAMRQRIYDFVSERLDGILESMHEKARGVAIIDKKDDTGERIFDLPPDPVAAKLLIEHAIGKPPEALDITSGDKPIAILANVFRNHGDKENSEDDKENQGDSGRNVSV